MGHEHHHSRRPADEVLLQVSGLHCTNCALSLERHLTRVGAGNPSVDFASGRTTFTLADRSKLDAVIESIVRLGYSVSDAATPLGPERHTALLVKTAICAALTLPILVAMFTGTSIFHDPWLQAVLVTPVFLIGLQHFGLSGIRSVRAGVANMDVLIAAGILAGYTASMVTLVQGMGHQTVFFEAVASIVTFVLLGNLLEERAVRRTTSAIEALSNLQPSKALRITEQKNGSETVTTISLRDIRVGDTLQVNSGDRVPTDGTVIRGSASVNESMLTGESLPVDRAEGDKVIGGSIVTSGAITLQATAVGEDTILSSIIQLVRDAQQRKPAIQRVGDAVSAVFVPAVLIIAIVVFILGVAFFDLSGGEALVRALAILVVACPCAMGLATPTAIMVALGRAAQTGILIRGGDTLERLQKVSHIAFDKTGTLTTGNLAVRDLKTFNGCSPVEAQSLIVALQRHSSHPIAQALLRAYDKPGLPIQRLQDVQETKGVGIQGRSSNGEQYSCGGARIATQYNVSTNDDLVLFKDGTLVASLSLQDDVRPEASITLQRLKSLGLSASLVSGDRADKCAALGGKLGIETVKAQQLPEQKLAFIHSLQERYPGGVAYVGDGINDAPTLAEASVGISLSSGSDVAMHSAQVLLSGDTLARLPEAIALSRLTVSTIKQNLLWAFLYNVTCIPLAAGGFLTPLQGALLMTFSDVLIVGNSLRLKVRSLS